MVKDPGNGDVRSDAPKGLSQWLDSFVKASSEHKKTTIIVDYLVPYFHGKGTSHIRSPFPWKLSQKCRFDDFQLSTFIVC
jgi:hypothetical protein